MKKLKIVLTALAFLLLLAWSCMATWMWIDRSITLTYVGLSNDELFRSKNILGKLILSEWKGMSKKSVRKKLDYFVQKNEKEYPDELVFAKDEDGNLYLDNIEFSFDEKDVLKYVK